MARRVSHDIRRGRPIKRQVDEGHNGADEGIDERGTAGVRDGVVVNAEVADVAVEGVGGCTNLGGTNSIDCNICGVP